jgi:hypothetical protein
MHRKNKLFLLFMFIVITLSLLSALMPELDFDADGFWDSLITEGLLLVSVVFASLGYFYLSTRYSQIRIASPWLFSALLILPPISTL